MSSRVWPGACDRGRPCHILSAVAIASGPLMRITAIPPVPGGVEIAQIVSFMSWIVICSVFGRRFCGEPYDYRRILLQSYINSPL